MTYELLNIDVMDVNFKRKKMFHLCICKYKRRNQITCSNTPFYSYYNFFFNVFKQYYELDTLNILCI
jgi:hypothetical protein